MERFKVKITEVLVRVVTIEARDEYEAHDKVRKEYRDCDIVLDDSDLVDSTIKVIK